MPVYEVPIVTINDYLHECFRYFLLLVVYTFQSMLGSFCSCDVVVKFLENDSSWFIYWCYFSFRDNMEEDMASPLWMMMTLRKCVIKLSWRIWRRCPWIICREERKHMESVTLLIYRPSICKTEGKLCNWSVVISWLYFVGRRIFKAFLLDN
jgi:hypothetical protein